MYSLKELYKIGVGPSSSHSMGPQKAAEVFKERYPDCDHYEVRLYGSLALTGKGHQTDRAIKMAIENAEIIFDLKNMDIEHPNTMDFIGYRNGEKVGEMRIISVGGGTIKIVGEETKLQEVYQEKTLAEILDICQKKQIRLYEYVYENEPQIKKYLHKVWKTMVHCIEEGLNSEGTLPGGLEIAKKAKYLHEMRVYNESSDITHDRLVSSYAYAVCEQNADCKTVVTAPTCGSSGVLPAVLYYCYHEKGFPENKIVDALATAGIIGNVIKRNGSLSGAEAGCQAEVGSACSMASAALAELYGMDMHQIEYAAEVAMEHHLGLTCDPINGLVQIPCIERNAVAAMRAFNCVSISNFLADTSKISFDWVVETMYQTGKDLSASYRETAKGGLAKLKVS